MKNRFIQIIKVIAFCLVIQSLFNKAEAQDCACGDTSGTNDDDARALPKMWVSKDSSKKWIDQLRKPGYSGLIKYDYLKNYLFNSSPTYFIPAEQIYFLADRVKKVLQSKGLRITFACFIATSSNTNIDLEDNQLILLFSPADKDRDYGQTYVIDNSGQRFIVSKTDKQNWITQYEKTVLPNLTRTIDSKEKDNDYDGKPSDTRSIYYEKKRINQAFVEEIREAKIDFKGFKITLAAYDKNGKRRTNYDTHQYRYRMCLQFDYVRNDETTFYFEDLPDFCCRLNKWLKDPDNREISAKNPVVDNGHLCPANCPKFQAPTD